MGCCFVSVWLGCSRIWFVNLIDYLWKCKKTLFWTEWLGKKLFRTIYLSRSFYQYFCKLKITHHLLQVICKLVLLLIWTTCSTNWGLTKDHRIFTTHCQVLGLGFCCLYVSKEKYILVWKYKRTGQRSISDPPVVVVISINGCIMKKKCQVCIRQKLVGNWKEPPSKQTLTMQNIFCWSWMLQ